MFKHYLHTALRTFWRQKGYTLLNLMGLSVGLACAMLIILWVQYERSFDRFLADSDRVFLVMRNAFFTNGQVHTWAAIPKPLAKVMEEEYPEVEHVALYSWGLEMLLSREEHSFRENGRYAGPDYLQILSLPVLQGQAETALSDPDGIAISASLAEKYFGEGWNEGKGVLGELFRIDNHADHRVTAVFSDLPKNSSFQFDFLLPIEVYIRNNEWVEDWGNNGLRMLTKLKPGVEYPALSEKIRQVINTHNTGGDNQLFLQPLTDVHLYNDYREGKLAGGRIEYVRIFSIVAVFILLIAAINFMNLATARSSRRAREIGIRKVAGASQSALVVQFLGEAILIAFLALLVAGLLVELLLPAFNNLLGLQLQVQYLDPGYSLTFLGIALLTGLFAGIYPAFFLAQFQVVNVLKGAIRFRFSGLAVRKGLVVFQFAMSILLIIGTLTVYRQVDFLKNKNLGLDKENVVYLYLDHEAQEKYETLRQELLNKPGIQSVTGVNQYPFSVGISTGGVKWEGRPEETDILFHILTVDYNYPEAMRMPLLAGRSFSKDFGSDSASFVINETAARVMDMENPVGEKLDFWGRKGHIIGVVKDFHFNSLHAGIEPIVLRLEPGEMSYLMARTLPGQTEEALASLQALHQQFSPAYPFEYHFLDQQYEAMYKSETVIGQLARYFAFMAVFISCLGLLGLAAFTAEQRTKEIGIRKVLGASVPNLVILLSRDFTLLVLLSFALAAPAAWYFLRDWLQDFAYHANLGVGVFLLAGILSVLIAWLTIGYQALKAAMANPVKALRSE